MWGTGVPDGKTTQKHDIRQGKEGTVQYFSVAFGVILLLSLAPSAFGGEIMKDQCSADVAIVPDYNARPDARGTVFLRRGNNPSTNWTEPFQVRLSPQGRIRWWCRSTTGNWLDLGTWRAEGEGRFGCIDSGEGGGVSCYGRGSVTFYPGASAWRGWTPERSRCNSRSNTIRARLAPERGRRLFLIECL
jgi:hypothetical protein